MKVSVSLPGDDVRFLDAYASETGLPSRSAALHQAVRLLRIAGLTADYEGAWEEWAGSDEASTWDVAAADGLESDAQG